MRTVRISAAIWDPAERRALSEGKNVVDVVREKLTEYGTDTNEEGQSK